MFDTMDRVSTYAKNLSWNVDQRRKLPLNLDSGISGKGENGLTESSAGISVDNNLYYMYYISIASTLLSVTLSAIALYKVISLRTSAGLIKLN